MRIEAGAAGRRGEPSPSCDPTDRAAAEALALRVLAAAGQSAAALQRRLQRHGFDDDAAGFAVERMRACGYVDDGRLAAHIAERAQRSGHGRARIAATLRGRAIDEEAVHSTLAQIDPAAEQEGANAAARMLSARILADGRPNARQRLGGALQRRGFSLAVITRALRTLVDEEPAD